MAERFSERKAGLGDAARAALECEHAAALRSSQEYYRSIIQNSSDAIAVMERDGHIRQMNDAGYSLFGFEVGDPQARQGALAVHPDDFDTARRGIAATFQTGASAYECRVRRADGTWAYCEVRGRRIKDPNGQPVAVFNTRDISQRRAAENSLLATQAQLRFLLAQQRAVAELGQRALRTATLDALLDDAVSVLVRTLDVEYCAVMELQDDGRRMVLRAGVGWNADSAVMTEFGTGSQTGYTLMTAEPVVVDDFSTEDRFQVLGAVFDRGIQSGISSVIPGSKGPYGVVSVSTVRPRRFTSDDAAFLQSVANIVAHAVERMAGEQALRRNEEFYRSILHNSSDAIAVIDRRGTVRYANDAGYTLFGYEVGNPVAAQEPVVVHPDDLDTVRCGMAATFAGQPSVYECRIRRRDGSWAYCEVRGRAITDPEGQAAGVFITRDISQRKAAERDLLETQAQLRARLQQERAIAELGEHALCASELESLLKEAAVTIATTLNVEFSALDELQPDGKKLRIRAAVGWPIGIMIDAVAASHAGCALSSSAPVVVEDFRTEARVRLPSRYARSEIRSGIAVLVGGRDRPWGVAEAHSSKPRKFTQDDAIFMQAVATITAQAAERLAAEEALRRREKFFRTLIHNSSDVILVFKPNGIITFSSDSVRQFGRPHERYLGTTGMEYVHPEDYESIPVRN
jgi:PAS domain S-box-containing protein